jgi:hypothetical protein
MTKSIAGESRAAKREKGEQNATQDKLQVIPRFTPEAMWKPTTVVKLVGPMARTPVKSVIVI